MYKRLLPAGLIALSLAVAVPLGPGTIPARASAEAESADAAEAAWLVRKGNRANVYYVFVWRAATAEGIETSVYFEVERCKWSSGGLRDCRWRWDEVDIAPTDFDLDLTLASASLRFGAGGYSNEVRWKGKGDAPETYAGTVLDTDWTEAYAWQVREATASGRLFGTRASERHLLFAAVGRGAYGLIEPDEGPRRHRPILVTRGE